MNPDRHRKPHTSHVARVLASRGQSLFNFLEPPPHAVHAIREAPPPAAPSPTLARGEKAMAHDLLAAVRVLISIEREHRPATHDERDILARFPGFGPVALSIFPDPATGAFKPGWEEIGCELESLLSPEEYSSAKRATFSQFFTSPAVMDAMHDALTRLGVHPGATVLEPGCGVCRFMTGPHRYIGVEMDPTTGKIARALHPQADIRIENFRDTKLPPLDAVIGNVPFGDVKLDYRGERLSLHDYFIRKSLDALKPGGVLAVVTSHFTLDRMNASAREKLAETADFLGAVRLPSTAFKAEGTQVVTDILFLRKRGPGMGPSHADDAWLQSSPIPIGGADIPINRYFLAHPDMVLGTWSREDRLYGAGYSVKPNGDLAGQLKEAVGKIADRAVKESLTAQSVAERPNPPPIPAQIHGYKPTFTPPPPLRHITEGSLFVGDDRVIRQVEDGKAEPVTYSGVLLRADGTSQARRIASLIGLRDLARRVLQSQNEGWPEANRQEARRDLNHAYDRFVAQHGPINRTTFTESKTGAIRRMPNLAKFREDPDAMLVMSLEEYDEATGRAEKAAIMRRDVVGPKPPISSVSSAEEGLLVALDERGGVDLPFIAGLYGKPEAEVIAELGDLIYRDPESEKWLTADDYLSGNVRHKLAVAEAVGPEYARNAESLRQVQPEDVLPGDIDANLGAPWIPASDIRQFAAELFAVPIEAFKVDHLKKDAVWSVEPDYRAISSVAATADFGTGRINGTDLLGLALNLRSPVIYDIVRGPNGDERVLNPTETQAAKEKQKLIKERFKAWVFTDPDRTERLVRAYNDTYNNLRPRLFDGSHLDFPGMSKAITLNPHQVDAVWRCMTGGNTLLAHAVGAGKAQPLDAKVLTPTGWARMGNLKPGDSVIAGDGSPTVVTGVYPQGEKEIYRVKFSDGSSTECCDEHLWLTWTYRERSQSQRAKKLGKTWECGTPKVRTTGEIRNTTRSSHLNAINHSIPMVGKVRFDQQEIPIDPYTLGALLGDGGLTTKSPKFTTIDDEILGNLSLPDNLELSLQGARDGCQTWGFRMKKMRGFGAERTRNPLEKSLSELGLVGVKSAGKFVPENYKFNSPEVRLAVLQGLLDTDGSVSKRGHSVYFYTVAPRLADDVTFLVQSLGGLVRMKIKERPTFRHKGELRVGQPCFVLCISLPAELMPFRLSRKAQKVIPKSSYAPVRYIVEIEPMGAKPAQCISVAHASHLYVTDDFIVTHNSFEMAAAGMKMKQAGLIKKPMYCIPNHMLEQFSREFMQLYPNARLLVAGKEDFTKEKRKLLTAKIATGDWDGIIVTHSSFEKIGMSRDFQERFLREQIAEYEALLVDKASKGRNIIKTLEKQKANREERLKSLLAEEKKDSGLVFDELGIDQIFIDESMYAKNLETPTKMDRVAGIPSGGSERAFDLFMKCRYLDERHPCHGVVFACGTPITNSMVEMYTNQRFLDPKGLSDRGIEHFDAWAATFGEVVDSMEISPDGASLRPRSRFAKFVNLPELVQMFRAFADVQTAEMLDLPRPKLESGKPQTIACPMSEDQKELQAGLIKRYDRIRSERVDPREDNALSITTDGRKLALDGRMLSAGGDFPGSKINALVANVSRIWKQTEAKRGTQMVFCDMGVNPNPFSAYDEIVEKLAEIGIPRGQIAVMGDADTDAKKQALFEKVRQGTVRVLLGSTAKMGTGTNVQKRLVALHHLDAPWKPAEVEQRDGRILRQGNENEEVAIYRYVTEGSFDAYMWQALETKARFIAQVMSGDCAVRKAEDLGGQELSYAEVKAIASGNPAVLTLAESDAELQRLAILRKNHLDEQYQARRNIRDLPDDIRRLEKRLAGMKADRATVAADDRIPSQDSIGERLNRMPDRVGETYRTKLGTYRGLDCGIILHPLGGTEVYLEGATHRRETLMRDNPGPRAVLNAMERLAGSYDRECRGMEAEIGVKQGQLRDYEARLGRAFEHAEYMSQLADLRDRLREGLSERAQQEPVAEGPTVSELAERIKALREANTVEAAPERAVRKVARAERPVTARIRARRAGNGGPEESVVETTPEKGEVKNPEPPQVAVRHLDLLEAETGHARRVARRRSEGEGQMRLF